MNPCHVMRDGTDGPRRSLDGVRCQVRVAGAPPARESEAQLSAFGTPMML